MEQVHAFCTIRLTSLSMEMQSVYDIHLSRAGRPGGRVNRANGRRVNRENFDFLNLQRTINTYCNFMLFFFFKAPLAFTPSVRLLFARLVGGGGRPKASPGESRFGGPFQGAPKKGTKKKTQRSLVLRGFQHLFSSREYLLYLMYLVWGSFPWLLGDRRGLLSSTITNLY